jgi:DNA-binding MarR family transcriptional regulator
VTTVSDATKAPGSATVPQGWSSEMLELGSAFRRVARALNRMRGRDTHLGDSELGYAQFELLIELHDRGPLPAGELATAAGLAPGTVTQMLDHLAACGHVERVRSETDRRVVVTRVTRSGRRKLEAKRAAWRARWEGALGELDADEMLAATRVLERLGTMFEEVSSESRLEGSEQTSEDPAKASGG